MRILIAEDDVQLAEIIKASLEAECYVVDMVNDGAEAIYNIKINDYDVVILDNQMPEKTGIEVCSEVRDAGKMVPILVLSVLDDSTTKADLLNAGADDYMTKPYSLAELLARIRALLRRPQQVEEEILEIDNLIVDTRRNYVERGGKKIYLTRKEFMLLEYLLRNQSIVMSRGMIMEHVWDMNADPFSNTIESHILNLRKKIDIKGENKLIHTVPNRGYKIEMNL
jgi:DNA-binding response OmpR family regulator